MQNLMTIFEFVSHLVLSIALAYYLASNLQWYNYKISRVILHHTKYHWHLLYFVVPLFAYYLTGIYFWIYFYFAYLPSLFLWKKKLDKPLVFTLRIKRVFVFVILAVLFQNLLCLASPKCFSYGVVMPLFFSFLISYFFEKMEFLRFEKMAKNRLRSINPTIVAITASYGKTSIKNILYHLIKDSKKTYKTPRSVNTIAGIIKDINQDLPKECEVYIVEAGARQKGDILQIAQLLEHQYALVGKIGEQHIEYFKTLEAIRDTKMELIHSCKLAYALVHESAHINPTKNIKIFQESFVKNLYASLDGIEFDLEIDGEILHFQTSLLGAFNAYNIAQSVYVAYGLGIDKETLVRQVGTLEPIEHRLQKIEANGKVILDDSFNGNLEGMISSYDLVNTFSGSKVIVTPGIVESTKEANEILAQKIDQVFDLAILPPSPNQALLATHIKNAHKIILKSKEELQSVLAQKTGEGDLILFSNDTPSYL